jgi:hypothetical protein
MGAGEPWVPIRRELRWFYPIDWAQVSARVRFERAKGRCERCKRPHGQVVHHLGDGRWFDAAAEVWRSGRGREVAWPAYAEYRQLRSTKVVLAAAHLDHDPSNSRRRNLRALSRVCGQWAHFGRVGAARTLKLLGFSGWRARIGAEICRHTIRWISIDPEACTCYRRGHVP